MKQASHRCGLRYCGVGLHNTNLSTKAGFKSTKKLIAGDDDITLASPPCTAYARQQNAKQRLSAQRVALRLKRRAAEPIFEHTFQVVFGKVEQSLPSIGQQPPCAASWKATAWRRMKKLLPLGVNVCGCQVGLKSVAPSTKGKLMSKTWHFRTNSTTVHRALVPFSKCRCRKQLLPHAPCEGVNTKHSQHYPEKLSRTLVRAAKKIIVGDGTSSGLPWRGAVRTRISKKSKASAAYSRATRLKLRRVGQRVQPKTKRLWRETLCKGMIPSCRGGQAVVPGSIALKKHFVFAHGRVKVYCKRCLTAYTKRYVPCGSARS